MTAPTYDELAALRALSAVVDQLHRPPIPDSGTPSGWRWAQQVIDALLVLKQVTDTGRTTPNCSPPNGG